MKGVINIKWFRKCSITIGREQESLLGSLYSVQDKQTLIFQTQAFLNSQSSKRRKYKNGYLRSMHIFTPARLLKILSPLASVNAIITWEETFQKCPPSSRHRAEQANFRTIKTLVSRFCQCRVLKTSFQFLKPHEQHAVHSFQSSLFLIKQFQNVPIYLRSIHC